MVRERSKDAACDDDPLIQADGYQQPSGKARPAMIPSNLAPQEPITLNAAPGAAAILAVLDGRWLPRGHS